jgi:hypothetical protein
MMLLEQRRRSPTYARVPGSTPDLIGLDVSLDCSLPAHSGFEGAKGHPGGFVGGYQGLTTDGNSASRSGTTAAPATSS